MIYIYIAYFLELSSQLPLISDTYLVELQNEGTSEKRMITIKISKTNHQKQQKIEAKNFCTNSLNVGMNL